MKTPIKVIDELLGINCIEAHLCWDVRDGWSSANSLCTLKIKYAADCELRLAQVGSLLPTHMEAIYERMALTSEYLPFHSHNEATIVLLNGKETMEILRSFATHHFPFETFL